MPPLFTAILFLVIFSWLLMSPPVPDPQIHLDDLSQRLQKAASFLNLPTWIQSYDPCTCGSCDLVFQAYHFFRAYAPTLAFNATPGSYISWIWEGMGNHIWGDTIGFTFAAMSNQSLTVFMTGPFPRNAYDYVPGVRYASEIPDFSQWPTTQLFRSHDVPFITSSMIDRLSNLYLITRFTYPAFVYVQPLFWDRLYRIFGDYAFYFMSNFLVRFPPDLMSRVMAVTGTLPPHVELYGFHMRWNKDSDMFIGTVDKGISRVRPVVEAAVRAGQLLVIASDSALLRARFLELAGDPRLLVSVPPFASDSPKARLNPLADLILVMYCRRYVLTLRSSFSSIISQRSGKTPLWVCNYMPHLFSFSSSQVTWQTLTFYDDDYFTPNRMVRLRAENEQLLRHFFLHFGA